CKLSREDPRVVCKSVRLRRSVFQRSGSVRVQSMLPRFSDRAEAPSLVPIRLSRTASLGYTTRQALLQLATTGARQPPPFSAPPRRRSDHSGSISSAQGSPTIGDAWEISSAHPQDAE